MKTLEEAAEDYVILTDHSPKTAINDAFKAGALWREQQGWIDAESSEINNFDQDRTIVYFDNGEYRFYNDTDWPFAEVLYAFELPTPPVK